MFVYYAAVMWSRNSLPHDALSPYCVVVRTVVRAVQSVYHSSKWSVICCDMIWNKQCSRWHGGKYSRSRLSLLQVLLQLLCMSESRQRMSNTVLETWTEVSAWIYFFNGQTGVRILVGIGQRTVFLEQCWGLEGEGLLKLAHTQMWDILMSNLALLNIIPLRSTGILRRVTLCESINLLYEMSRFQLDKGVTGEIWDGSVWCEWRAPLPPVFYSPNSSQCTSVKSGKDWQSRAPVPLVRITHYQGF